MQLDIGEFKELIRKATLNYYIDSVRLDYNKSKDRITSNMVSDTRKVAVILDIDNEMLVDCRDDVSFLFNLPKVDVKPYIELLDNGKTMLKINDNNMVINNQIKLQFSDPSVITSLTTNKLKDAARTCNMCFKITSDFIEKYKKVKSIANKFGKFYLSLADDGLYLETTDKNNHYSNAVKYNIVETDKLDVTDGENEQISISDIKERRVPCFESNAFISLISTIIDNYSDYTMCLSYLTDDEVCIVSVSNEDEQYIIVNEFD